MTHPQSEYRNAGTNLVRLAFWAALVFALIMALLPHPPSIPNASDKIQHIAAFTVLSLLAGIGYYRAGLIRVGAGLAIFGALIEILQAIPVLHRDASAWDWMADCAAIIVTLLLVRFWRR